MSLSVELNGQTRAFADLENPSSLSALVDALGLKADRIAVEHNGEIAGRSCWGKTLLHEGDRLEVVHFVGGGCFC